MGAANIVLNAAQKASGATHVLGINSSTGAVADHLGQQPYSAKGKKGPVPAIAYPFSAADITAITGSPTIDYAATAPDGKPAIKITFTAAAAGSSCEVSLAGLIGCQMFGDVYLSIYGSRSLSGANNFDYVTFYAGADAGYSNGCLQFIQNGLSAPMQSYLEQGGAITHWYRKARMTAIGTPTYPFTIAASKLRVIALAAGQCVLYIHAIGVASPPAKKGRLAVVWDDGYDSMFKLGYDIFASRNLTQTISVISSVHDTGIGGASRWSQLAGFLAAGNSIVPHGPRASNGVGNMTQYSPAVAVADVQATVADLAARGLLLPGADRCYVWPQGTYQLSANDTSYLDAMIAAGFTTCRGTSTVAGSTVYPGVNIDALSKYQRMSIPIIGHTWAGTTAAEATNIAAVVAAVQALGANKSDATLMLHRVLPDSTNDTTMGTAGNITIRYSDLVTIANAIQTEVANGTLEVLGFHEFASQSYWGQF